MGNFRGWEWIIILVLALLLFGGFKKLPDAARGIGRSLRIFKAETKGLADDEDPKEITPDGGSETSKTDAPAAAESAPKAPVTTAPTAGEDSANNKS